MKIADADNLFTRGQFLRQMLPPMFGSSIFFAGIGYSSINSGYDTGAKLLALCGIFMAALVLQILRYQLAGQKHKELKQLYGERYVSLVEGGKIPISPTGILILNAPWSQVRKLIPEESAYIPPRER